MSEENDYPRWTPITQTIFLSEDKPTLIPATSGPCGYGFKDTGAELRVNGEPRALEAKPPKLSLKAGDIVSYQLDTGVMTIQRAPEVTSPTLTEAQEKCMPKFNAPLNFPPVPVMEAALLAERERREAVLARVVDAVQKEVGKQLADKLCQEMAPLFRELFSEQPAAPAKPHPLQRLAEPPSVFGQSLWRPWEM